MNMRERKIGADLINTWLLFCSANDLAMAAAGYWHSVHTATGSFESGFSLVKGNEFFMQAEVANCRKVSLGS